MKPTCRVVQVLAPTQGALGTRFSGHVSTCLACQAEIARYGRLRRQLAALADVTVAAPYPLATAVAAEIVSSTGERTIAPSGRLGRILAAGGAVAAAAAGAVVVALWRNSRPAVR